MEACTEVCIKWKLATEITGFHLGLHIPFESNFNFKRLEKFTNLVHLELDALFLNKNQTTHIEHEKLRNLVITHHQTGNLRINCPSLIRFSYGGIFYNKIEFTHTKQVKILEIQKLHKALNKFKNVEVLKIHNFRNVTKKFALKLPKLRDFHSECLAGALFGDYEELTTRDKLKETIGSFLGSLPTNCTFTLNKVLITEKNLIKLDLGKSDPVKWSKIRELCDQDINKPLRNPKSHFCLSCNKLEERITVSPDCWCCNFGKQFR